MKVFISGCGIMSSLGNSPTEMFGQLIEGQSAVRNIEAWKDFKGLNCRLGAPAAAYDISKLPRTARRTMSRMSEMASLASQQALAQAGLTMADLDFPRTLLSLGSTTGSPIALEDYFNSIHKNNGVQSQSGTAFFKVMNHSVASNVAVALGFN
ncbi:MAG: beta-ketoacyl-[acyl-carrier-protein] synthase family protein, partial [Proteobacteria bacterium]